MNEALKALQLKARHQVYTLLSGHNLSKLHGEGYDFAELREYQMGDDIRKINWTITAKLGKPYIKELHANRELSIVVCALMDASLYFGAGNDKQKKLCEVATILGYAAEQNADLFTGIAYTQNQVIDTPPTKQLYHINHFSESLYETNVLHTTLDKQEAINRLFKRMHKPSLLFVLGDFLEELDLSVLAQKHEVVAIIIRERQEETPKRLGEVSLTNPRNKETLETYFGKRSITHYKATLQAHEEKRSEHFTRYDIRSVTIYTDEDAISKLITLFA
jgi:uncharacterized protein (DUF58 family)